MTGVEPYEEYFGLHEPPFSLAPDPRFLFASASHSAALAQVAYAIERREPVVVITGDIGTGKTLLCRTVLRQLPHKTFLSVIHDPLLERDDLLKHVLEDFGVISADESRIATSRHQLIDALQRFLRSLAPIQAHAVVMIDEAQHLQPDVLEEIRLLSNIADERGTLLQIILVGQSDLDLLLSRPELRQLQQRISRRFQLQPLNTDEVRRYVEHRLVLAGTGAPAARTPGAAELARELAAWTGAEPGVAFTPDAIAAVTQLSGGLPRIINLLCDRALEEAYARRVRLVDDPVIDAAARALTIAAPPAAAATSAFWRPTPPARPAWATPTESAVTSEEVIPAAISARHRGEAASQSIRYAVVFGAVAAIAAGVWLAVRAVRQPETPAAVTATRATPPPQRTTPPEPAVPAAPTPPPPAPALSAGTSGSPASMPPAAAPAPAAGRFDIVVASFRTGSRAGAVSSEVTALGLPVRRRVTNGWQQVIAGPFPTRSDAEDAQQRLGRTGLTGSQIVPAGR
jgi:general secretion pathway protein A